MTFSLYLPLSKEALNPLSLYLCLKEAWLKTLQEIGLFPDSQSNPQRNYLSSPYCFSLNTTHEITVKGKKIIGIAQVRAKRGVLFQGSFVISGNRKEIASCFLNHEKIEQELWSNFITLEELISQPPGKEKIILLFLNHLASVLDVYWFEGKINSDERKKAEELFQTKYAPLSIYHVER